MRPATFSGPAGAEAPAPSRRPGRFLPLLMVVALGGALAGCGTSVPPAASATAPPATGVVMPVRAADPVAGFAATAQSGQSATVTRPDGQVVSARMVRVYNAASGRECREVQFGPSGVAGGAPGATYCNDPAQGWVAARPLLRGGAVYRP